MKLSLCIPTLNRGHLISETLESIVGQVTPEVEVVIVDGGSTDNTAEIVGRFQRRFPFIRYCRPDVENERLNPQAPSNGGFDIDCDRAVQKATGEYCWLFTDDDILKPGAIRVVLNAILRGYQVIIVNAEVRSSDLSEVLEPARLKMTQDRAYQATENQQLFSDVGNYLSFVGAVVVRRDLWGSRQKEPYIGTGLIHIGMLFQSLIPGKSLVVAEPLISIRYGDAQYMRTSRYFEIWMFTWPNLIWSFADFSDSAKRKVCLREPWRRLRTLLLFRAIGAFSTKEYDKWLSRRLRSSWEKLAARVIASFPGSVANLIGVAYYYVSGSPPGQFLLDLVKSPYYFARTFTPSTVHGPRKSAGIISASDKPL